MANMLLEKVSLILEAYSKNMENSNFTMAIKSARKLAAIGANEERDARARWRSDFLATLGRLNISEKEREAIADPKEPLPIGSTLLWGRAVNAKGTRADSADCIVPRFRRGISYTAVVAYGNRDVDADDAARNAVRFAYPARFGKGPIEETAETESAV